MHKFVFIGFVLLVVTLAGCKELQPVTVVNCETDTVTLVDTTIVTIQDKDILKALIECDSNYTAQWIDNSKLVEILDSLKSIGIQVVVKNRVVYKDKNKTIEKVIIQKAKPEIIKKTPFWAYVSAVGNIILLFSQLVSFFIMYRLSKK